MTTAIRDAITGLEQSRRLISSSIPHPNRHGRIVILAARHIDRLTSVHNKLGGPLVDLRDVLAHDDRLRPETPKAIQRERDRLKRLRRHLPLGVLLPVDDAINHLDAALAGLHPGAQIATRTAR